MFLTYASIISYSMVYGFIYFNLADVSLYRYMTSLVALVMAGILLLSSLISDNVYSKLVTIACIYAAALFLP